MFGFLTACILLSLPFFIFFLIYFFTHDSPSDEIVVLPLVFIFVSYPQNIFLDVVRGTLSVLLSIMLLTILLSTGFILKMNWRIFSHQWRGLFSQMYLGDVVYIGTWFHVSYKINSTNVADYVECVGSSPREDPPPCTRSTSGGALVAFNLFLFYFFPLMMSVVFYFTNSFVLIWWKELIFYHHLIRSQQEIERTPTVASAVLSR